MTGAIALYASRGFKVRSPYYEIPPSFGPVTVFMELGLGQAMPHPPILGTSRLRLEPFGPEHFEAFYTHCICDAAVMGFYHAYAAPEPDAQRRARAQRDFVDHFAQGAMQHGYICWALTSGPALAMPAGTFLGWAGILEPALDHSRWGPELAYMLARRCQGQGLATEASTAVLADAWTRYGLQRLHAVVDEPNLPSRRVLERLGFRLLGPVEVYGSAAMLLYDVVAPRHESKEAPACTV